MVEHPGQDQREELWGAGWESAGDRQWHHRPGKAQVHVGAARMWPK